MPAILAFVAGLIQASLSHFFLYVLWNFFVAFFRSISSCSKASWSFFRSHSSYFFALCRCLLWPTPSLCWSFLAACADAGLVRSKASLLSSHSVKVIREFPGDCGPFFSCHATRVSTGVPTRVSTRASLLLSSLWWIFSASASPSLPSGTEPDRLFFLHSFQGKFSRGCSRSFNLARSCGLIW